MSFRFLLLSAFVIFAAPLYGQDQAFGPGQIRKWHPLRDRAEAPIRLTAGTAPAESTATTNRVLNVSGLPNKQGQVFRQYDIAPYTLRATTENKPQQSVVDWILRETGYETWHSDTVSILSATHRSLLVYHTPEIHRKVLDIVQRFNDADAANQIYSVRIITVGHPDWRSRAQKLLQPVPIQSQGAEAWLLAKEDAARLLSDLSRRADYRSHGSPRMVVNNGEHAEVVLTRVRSFTRSMLSPATDAVGRDQHLGQFHEGISLELSPLLSLDGQYVDAMVKCKVDQLEKLVPVRLEAPGSLPQARQWYDIDVPCMVSNQLHERFRWPRDKVLLVSLGVVPRPIVEAKNPLKLPFKTLPLGSDAPPRGDALILVETTGAALRTDTASGAHVPQSESFRGRY